MREEIRLGNATLAHNDLEAAKQHFQHLLDHGGTHIQEQIATNRLREIAAKQEALSTPPQSTSPTRQRAKARARAKK